MQKRAVNISLVAPSEELDFPEVEIKPEIRLARFIIEVQRLDSRVSRTSARSLRRDS